MWLASKHGFFSITVAPAQPDKRSLLQLRALDESQLRSLLDETGFDAVEVIATPYRDYPFRAFLSRAEVQSLMRSVVSDIDYDYDNFKSVYDWLSPFARPSQRPQSSRPAPPPPPPPVVIIKGA